MKFNLLFWYPLSLSDTFYYHIDDPLQNLWSTTICFYTLKTSLIHYTILSMTFNAPHEDHGYVFISLKSLWYFILSYQWPITLFVKFNHMFLYPSSLSDTFYYLSNDPLCFSWSSTVCIYTFKSSLIHFTILSMAFYASFEV